MKISELTEKAKDTKIVVQNLKPRDPNQQVLANKRNAGGAMRDKKQEFKRGESKHKGRAFESLVENLEDNQSELVSKFNELVAQAKKKGWKQDRIAQFKKQFDTLNRNFASVYYNDDEDDNEDAIESVLDSMEELLDEFREDLNESRVYEASLGSRVEYDSYKNWENDLPENATFHQDGSIERAQAIGKDFEGVAGTWYHDKKTGWIYAYYLNKKNIREDLSEGRRHVYGPGDKTLIDHPNKEMAMLGRGETLKVMTKQGVAKVLKVQFYNGGSMFKLDREIKHDDGSRSAWVSDRDVSFDLEKGAAPDAKTFARKNAMGEALSEGWHNHKGGSGLFTADMSEIESHMRDRRADLRGTSMTCPGCREKIKLSDFKKNVDREGEVTDWTLVHSCGAKLRIFND